MDAIGSELIEQRRHSGNYPLTLRLCKDSDGTRSRGTPSDTARMRPRRSSIASRALYVRGSETKTSLSPASSHTYKRSTASRSVDLPWFSADAALAISCSSRKLRVVSDLLENSARRYDLVEQGRKKLELADSSQRDQWTGIDDERHARIRENRLADSAAATLAFQVLQVCIKSRADSAGSANPRNWTFDRPRISAALPEESFSSPEKARGAPIPWLAARVPIPECPERQAGSVGARFQPSARPCWELSRLPRSGPTSAGLPCDCAS